MIKYNFSHFCSGLSGVYVLSILNASVSGTELGLFLFATTILYGPVAIISRSFGDVFLVNFGKVTLSQREFRLTFVKGTLVLGMLALLMWMIVQTIPDWIYISVLGEKWSGIGDVLRILVIGCALNLISASFDKVLLMRRKVIYLVIYNLVRLAVVLFAATYLLDWFLTQSFLDILTVFVIFQVVVYLIDWTMSAVSVMTYRA